MYVYKVVRMDMGEDSRYLSVYAPEALDYEVGRRTRAHPKQGPLFAFRRRQQARDAIRCAPGSLRFLLKILRCRTLTKVRAAYRRPWSFTLRWNWARQVCETRCFTRKERQRRQAIHSSSNEAQSLATTPSTVIPARVAQTLGVDAGLATLAAARPRRGLMPAPVGVRTLPE